jgi:hypothetical protein
MPPEIPTVARVVHYVSLGSADGRYPSLPRAATITEVDPDDCNLVGLAVVNPTGMFFNPLTNGGSRYDAGTYDEARGETTYAVGSWHWPPRAPQRPADADA